jgi:BirA family biotin operon repressor/biotin-[acetyl-CoA-carboxylase] ligase
LLRALLRELAAWYQRWCAAGGDADACGLRAEYQVHCATIGRAVRVALPGDTELLGTASDVDSAGRLLITGADGQLTPVAAGDVIHVR